MLSRRPSSCDIEQRVIADDDDKPDRIAFRGKQSYTMAGGEIPQKEDMTMVKVTVWNEFRHEQNEPRIKEVYPNGIHGAIAEMLGKHTDYIIRTATLDEPENGLPQEVLDDTDVLIW